MLGPDHIRSLLRDALRNLHLGDADIYLTATTQALTRFANNRIHQNVYHDDAVAHIRIAYQKRQGRAVTNNLSSDGLRTRGFTGQGTRRPHARRPRLSRASQGVEGDVGLTPMMRQRPTPARNIEPPS